MKKVALDSTIGADKTLKRFKLDPEKVAFLFGAGVSLRGPTNLPLANQILKTIQTGLESKIQRKLNWRSDTMPQFEVIMDCLRAAKQSTVGKLMAVFKKVAPNPNHRFLAELGKAGCQLITTNFDRNVEAALGKQARAIYNDSQAGRYRTRGTMVPVLKLHGCISSSGSIVTTISGLGRRGSIRSADVLSAGRRKALRRFLDGRFCFAIGYSGSDALDIVPALQRIRNCRIVLLQHHNTRQVSVESLTAVIKAGVNGRPASRTTWFDGTPLIGETTEFLSTLFRICGRRAPTLLRVRRKNPDLTAVIKATDSLTRVDAEKAVSQMEGKGSFMGRYESKAQRYSARLRGGVTPGVSGGGSINFPFPIGALSAGTRASVCFEAARALLRVGRKRGVALKKLRQAIGFWRMVRNTKAQERAQALLNRVTAPSKKNARS